MTEMRDGIVTDEIEYDCADCGRHVIAWGFYGVAEPGKRCADCDWIRDHVQPTGNTGVADACDRLRWQKLR
jgi:DNA-directed RNA polymerase subunit RPC12/RpoP